MAALENDESRYYVYVSLNVISFAGINSVHVGAVREPPLGAVREPPLPLLGRISVRS